MWIAVGYARTLAQAWGTGPEAEFWNACGILERTAVATNIIAFDVSTNARLRELSPQEWFEELRTIPLNNVMEVGSVKIAGAQAEITRCKNHLMGTQAFNLPSVFANVKQHISKMNKALLASIPK